MITGFNTDVEHEGVTYHVQTEDKGLKSPLILSLVYVGGTILASKRTPYDDLIADGFEESKLAERLNRQHKLICAAIHAGRIEDLKRQTEREASARAKTTEPEEQRSEAPEVKEETPVISQETPVVAKETPVISRETPATVPEPPPVIPEDPDIIRSGSLADFMPPSVFTSQPAEKKLPAQAVASETPAHVEIPSGTQTEQVDYSRVINYTGDIGHVEELHISLLDEKRFVAGEFVKINVHVGSGAEGQENVSDATVTLKVLGSSFRPLIFSGKTAPDGTATFYAMLPYFTSGRAAILINAANREYRAELRRVIHQA